MKAILKICIKPMVVLFFWWYRFTVHNYNLLRERSLGSKTAQKPSIISYPFLLTYAFFNKLLKPIWKESFTDYGISQYHILSKKHYLKESTFNLLSYDLQKEIFEQLTGRVAFMLDDDLAPNVLDGDSILDVGCGKGQNLKVLTKKFPNSQISGFDYEDAIIYIKEKFMHNDKNLTVWRSDFTDSNYMQSIKNDNYDWVLMSHAFMFIFSEGLEETVNLRQRIIHSLIRIAKKGVIILESPPSIGASRFTFNIEKNTRAIMTDDITEYFKDQEGTLLMRKSSETFAYIFLKH